MSSNSKTTFKFKFNKFNFEDLNDKGKARFILEAIEGSWLVEALWDQLKDSKICQKIVAEFEENCGWDRVEEWLEDTIDCLPCSYELDKYNAELKELAKTDIGLKTLLDQYISDQRWEVTQAIFNRYCLVTGKDRV